MSHVNAFSSFSCVLLHHMTFHDHLTYYTSHGCNDCNFTDDQKPAASLFYVSNPEYYNLLFSILIVQSRTSVVT